MRLLDTYDTVRNVITEYHQSRHVTGFESPSDTGPSPMEIGGVRQRKDTGPSPMDIGGLWQRKDTGPSPMEIGGVLQRKDTGHSPMVGGVWQRKGIRDESRKRNEGFYWAGQGKAKYP